MKKGVKKSFVKILALLFLSCASSSDVYKRIDNAVFQNDFYRGLEELRNSQEGQTPIYAAGNSISFLLDKGLLEHYAGNYGNSSLDLQEAERLIEEAFTKSISAGIASYILNDNTKEYPGEDYEDIYLSVFNALNYYHNNDMEGAMVEIRRITMPSGKLDMLSRKYNDTGNSVELWAGEQLGEMGYNTKPVIPKQSQVNYANSVLARFLGALFYQGQGKTDDARIEFEQLRLAYNNNPYVYYNPLPKAVSDAQNIPPGKARLNVLCFSGLSPVKEEQYYNQYFPFFRNQLLHYVQFKLPVFRKRSSGINRIGVEVSLNGEFTLELLEDIGAVVEETYKARFANVFFKTYIRTLLKYAAADVVATEAAKKSESSFAGFMTSILVRETANATESADIRMGRYFPDKAHIGGINLDPGVYDITISFYQNGVVVAKETFQDVHVKANELNLIEAACLK